MRACGRGYGPREELRRVPVSRSGLTEKPFPDPAKGTSSSRRSVRAAMSGGSARASSSYSDRLGMSPSACAPERNEETVAYVTTVHATVAYRLFWRPHFAPLTPGGALMKPSAQGGPFGEV